MKLGDMVALSVFGAYLAAYRWGPDVGRAAGFAVAAGVLFWRGMKRYDQDRGFRDWPERASIMALSPGQRAAVEGVTRSPIVLSSPVSSEPCVFYEDEVERWNMFINPGPMEYFAPTNWEPGRIDREGAFFVADGTGEIFVFPQRATFELSNAKRSQTSDLDAASNRERHTQRIIAPGQRVSVAGTFQTLKSALEFARNTEGGGLNPDLIRDLQLRADRGQSLLCIYGGGADFIVSDQSLSAPRPPVSYVAAALFAAALGAAGVAVYLALPLGIQK
jgi:hypothetical protein